LLLKERAALTSKWHFEQKAKEQGFSLVAGVDEAGRGPIAGPLVVAACILPEQEWEIDDSKKLSPKQRDRAYHALLANPNVIYAIEVLPRELIDEINILQATLLGMQKVIAKLSTVPQLVLVDGNRAPSFSIPAWPIVQGDTLSYSIGAASILAKVTRDALMQAYDAEWPMYGFAEHKGYPTAKHIEALQMHGPCPIHRRSYAPVKSVLV